MSLGAVWTQAGLAFLDAHIRRFEKYRLCFMPPLHFIIEHISAKLFVLNHDSSLISLVDFTCPAYSPGDRHMLLHSWQFDREDQCHIQLDVLKALREIAQISRKRQDDFFK